MSPKITPESEPDPVEALLPWYAAGTLDTENRKRVDDALADDAALRASLRLVEEDRDETITLNETLGRPSNAALSRILAVASAEPRQPSILARLTNFFGFGAEPRPTRLAWAGAAAAFVIVAQAATITMLLPGAKTPSYQTASDQSAPVAGTTVLVMFAADARLDQVAEMLAKHQVAIVDGPRSGFFRVRIGDKDMPKADLDASIAALRSEPTVKLVLPSGR